MVKLAFVDRGGVVAARDVFTENLNMTICPESGVGIRYGVHYESLSGVLGGAPVLWALMKEAELVVSGGLS
jgi:hypothetical protein